VDDFIAAAIPLRHQRNAKVGAVKNGVRIVISMIGQLLSLGLQVVPQMLGHLFADALGFSEQVGQRQCLRIKVAVDLHSAFSRQAAYPCDTDSDWLHDPIRGTVSRPELWQLSMMTLAGKVQGFVKAR
jgi:hypothetical protein